MVQCVIIITEALKNSRQTTWRSSWRTWTKWSAEP